MYPIIYYGYDYFHCRLLVGCALTKDSRKSSVFCVTRVDTTSLQLNGEAKSYRRYEKSSLLLDQCKCETEIIGQRRQDYFAFLYFILPVAENDWNIPSEKRNIRKSTK